MGDTLITVVVIVLSVCLMVVFPVITLADRIDVVSELDVETATAEFIGEIKTTGKLKEEKYAEFVEVLTSNGNTYDIQLEFKIFDENPGKKTAQTVVDAIGENLYYSVFTTQIEERLEADGVYNLKTGDIISVTVRNKNRTLSEQLKDNFYTAIGSDKYSIGTTQTALIITTGT